MIFFRKKKEEEVEPKRNTMEGRLKDINVSRNIESLMNARLTFYGATITGVINGKICGVIDGKPFKLSFKGITTEDELVLENDFKNNLKSKVPYRHIKVDDRDLMLIPLVNLNQSHRLAILLNGNRIDIDYCLKPKILELDSVTLIGVNTINSRLQC